MGLNLNKQNLMKVINCRVIPVAGYVMNVCNLGKANLDKLDMKLKSALRREGFHGRQPSNEKLYSKRKGGRGLKSLKEVYDEQKLELLHGCSKKEWIRIAWRNEGQEKEAEKAARKVEWTVPFGEGSVIIGEECYTEWKEWWKKLKEILNKGKKGINNKVWQRRNVKVKS